MIPFSPDKILMMKKMLLKTLFWITLFALSMGFFESAVVIYLRHIYYPSGFAFPLQPMDQNLATTEMMREVFSLLMLLSVGILAGRSAASRFAWFIYSFALWDIFFYLFLKILTGWPPSMMTDDILFLLPVMWIGPVLAPLILAIAMILFALAILFFYSRNRHVQLNLTEIISLITGSVVIIISFTADYTGFIINDPSFHSLRLLTSESLSQLSLQYDPGDFPWFVFTIGIVIILSVIGLFVTRNVRMEKF
jgi:hypothetical protein